MKRLIELTDKAVRESIGEYYIISESRMNNILSVLESGAQRIKELTAMTEDQQREIAMLTKQLMEADHD